MQLNIPCSLLTSFLIYSPDAYPKGKKKKIEIFYCINLMTSSKEIQQ
jgi:hypothetical protein